MADSMTDEAKQAARPTIAALFEGFMLIGLGGFGGVGPMARYIIVEKNAWLSEYDYAAMFGVGQILPGGNVLNVAVMLGDRFRGPLGAIAALAGIVSAPLVILLILSAIYDRFSENADVRFATAGAAAAGAGLFIGTALKMGRNLKPTPVGLAIAAAAFLAIAVLRTPLLATVAVLAPLSVMGLWLERRK